MQTSATLLTRISYRKIPSMNATWQHVNIFNLSNIKNKSQSSFKFLFQTKKKEYEISIDEKFNFVEPNSDQVRFR